MDRTSYAAGRLSMAVQVGRLEGQLLSSLTEVRAALHYLRKVPGERGRLEAMEVLSLLQERLTVAEAKILKEDQAAKAGVYEACPKCGAVACDMGCVISDGRLKS